MQRTHIIIAGTMKNVKLVGLIFLLTLGICPIRYTAGGSDTLSSLSTEHFTLHFTPHTEALARSIAGQVEVSFTTICHALGVAPFRGSSLYICDTEADFRRWGPSVGSSWAVGVASPAQRRIVLKSPWLAKDSTVQFVKTLNHELSHLVLHRAVGKNLNLLPRWFDEGMAMLNADQWEWLDSWALFRMVIFSEPIPFESLHSSFPEGASEARLAYAQSYSFCLFLRERLGTRQFERLIAGLKEGFPIDAQLARMSRLSLKQITEAWFDAVKDKYGLYPVLTSGAFFWFAVSVLFVLAYVRKRRATKRRLEEMQAEDELIEHVLDGRKVH